MKSSNELRNSQVRRRHSSSEPHEACDILWHVPHNIPKRIVHIRNENLNACHLTRTARKRKQCKCNLPGVETKDLMASHCRALTRGMDGPHSRANNPSGKQTDHLIRCSNTDAGYDLTGRDITAHSCENPLRLRQAHHLV